MSNKQNQTMINQPAALQFLSVHACICAVHMTNMADTLMDRHHYIDYIIFVLGFRQTQFDDLSKKEKKLNQTSTYMMHGGRIFFPYLINFFKLFTCLQGLTFYE